MVLAITVLVFVGLLLLSVPIVFCLGVSAVVGMLLGGYPLQQLGSTMIAASQSWVLLAIPSFVFAGSLMERAGMSNSLVELARVNQFLKPTGGVAGAPDLDDLAVHDAEAPAALRAILAKNVSANRAIGFDHRDRAVALGHFPIDGVLQELRKEPDDLGDEFFGIGISHGVKRCGARARRRATRATMQSAARVSRN